MSIDLHAHTTYSDGILSPTQLVERAQQQGVTILAVTDHDCVSGVAEAQEAARRVGIRLQPGLELTTSNGQDVHVLGFFRAVDDPGLADFLAGLRKTRTDRLEKMTANLNKIGIAITVEEIANTAQEYSVGRPHVARALVKKGHAKNLDEAFARYLKKSGPVFVPHDAIPTAEGVRRIREFGGAPVVAHPGLYRDDAFLADLVPLGLAGIETYHLDNKNKNKTARYREMARQWGIAATGGSDYHGHPSAKYVELGTMPCPPEEFEKLDAAIGRG